MEYLIKIDKYVKDRFKIYEKDSEEVLYSGDKTGDAASYFDAFIGETYSKGANFDFYDKDRDKVLTIERNFYNQNKEYKLFSDKEQIGIISSRLNGEYVEIDIEYKNKRTHVSLNRKEYKLDLPEAGRIRSIKQGFKNYEELEITLHNKEAMLLLISVAVYIWDVFMKNKIAFISKKK